MRRCGAAAAAHDVDQPLGREFADQAAGDFGGLVTAGVTHRVGQAGVGVPADCLKVAGMDDLRKAKKREIQNSVQNSLTKLFAQSGRSLEADLL